MVLNNINPNKRKEMLQFFNEKFNIDLEKYEEDELPIVFNEVKNEINKKILEEKKKHKELTSQLESSLLDTLFMLK